MSLSEIIKSSFATLRMNGRRTFLTMFGIIIGIAAVITILSLGNGFRIQTLDSLAKDEKGRRSQEFFYSFGVFEGEIDKLEPFSEENIEAVENMAGVDEVELTGEELDQQYISVNYSNQDEMYYNADITQTSSKPIIAGRNLNVVDSQAMLANVIIDMTVAMLYFESPEEAIHQPIEIDGNTYTIVGVYAPEEVDVSASSFDLQMSQMSNLAVPEGTYRRYSQSAAFSFMMKVYYEAEADMKQINKEIASYLKENGKEKDNGTYEYYDSTEMMDQVSQQLQMITYFITAIAAISLFIAGVGVMNMMYISVSERTREIGIRRSLGATKKSIQFQFLLEGIVITTLGGLIGYFMGIAIATGVSQFIAFNAVFDVGTALLSVFISTFIGIIFSVFPARQASRKNVVEILR